MKAVVTSDVHIGSVHLRKDGFVKFLDSLPDGYTLILNGDILHREVEDLALEDLQLLDLLLSETRNRKVVWIRGNHDDEYIVPGASAVEFCDEYVACGSVGLLHGSQLMPAGPLVRLAAMFLRRFPITVNGEGLLSARLVRSMPRVYGVLERAVMRRAVRYARRRSWSSVICGHLHGVMDVTVDGIHYINTGSWTEEGNHYAVIEGNSVRCLPADNLLGRL